MFLDDEAELSGSEINEFSSDENGEGELEDSFINDASQLTQRTPTRAQKTRSPVDMHALYRQSLLSPAWNDLKFHTPLFHKQKNKYKMVYRKHTANNQSESEAEEVNELEDEAEFESEAEEESLLCAAVEESLARSPREVSNPEQFRSNGDQSFEESQIGRPMKRMKRKRILDDSLLEEEVSPKFSKQKEWSDNVSSNAPLEYDKQQRLLRTNAPPNSGDKSRECLEKTSSSRPYCNFPSKFVKPLQNNETLGGFVRSSSVPTQDEHVDINFKGSTRPSGNFQDVRTPQAARNLRKDVAGNDVQNTSAMGPPSTRLSTRSIETSRKTSLDLSSSLFSDDMSDTELVGALGTYDVMDCVPQLDKTLG